MRIALIDYKAGNLRNVQKAVEHLGYVADIVGHPGELKGSDAIILPGVGAFRVGMQNLERTGLAEAIRQEVAEHGKPLLGICLGMHLIGTSGVEGGEYRGLDLLPMSVPRFDTTMQAVRLPHIGWNSVEITPGSILFSDVPPDTDFYFVHSYHVVCDDSLVAARCNYCYPFAAAVERGNIFATQFHPEKSQRYGLVVLRNFLNYCVRSN
jgi:glutamine amidotransferase